MGVPQPSECQGRQLGARRPECVFRTEGRCARRASSSRVTDPACFHETVRSGRAEDPGITGQLRAHSHFGSRPSGLCPSPQGSLPPLGTCRPQAWPPALRHLQLLLHAASFPVSLPSANRETAAVLLALSVTKVPLTAAPSAVLPPFFLHNGRGAERPTPWPPAEPCSDYSSSGPGIQWSRRACKAEAGRWKFHLLTTPGRQMPRSGVSAGWVPQGRTARMILELSPCHQRPDRHTALWTRRQMLQV